MSGLRATCPGCGVEVAFDTPGSAAAVCPACHTLLARADAANLGRIADVVQGDTPLALGASGVYENRAFTLVGCTRLQCGDATWEEWYAWFPVTNLWGWLSYAQGRYGMYFVSDVTELPAIDSLKHDVPLRLADRPYRLVERGFATYVQASGELPFVPNGHKLWRFADLKGRDGAVATLSEHDATPTLYVGARTRLTALGMAPVPRSGPDALRTAAVPGFAGRPRVDVRQVVCPHCSAKLALHTGELAARIVCSFCGAMSDTSCEPLKLLSAAKTPPMRSAIPLGAMGELQGVRWRVVGCMTRELAEAVLKYEWREYLLHDPDAGFRWLVESEGHWTFVQDAEDVAQAEPLGPVLAGGITYRPYDQCTARVTYVLGEFYWPVARGDKVKVSDYMAPPASLSREESSDEVIWSAGVYLPRRTVQRAFPQARLPIAKGVAPNEPWVHGGYRVVALAVAALALLVYLVATAGTRVAGVATFQAVQRDQVLSTEPFKVIGARNAAVTVHAEGGTVALDCSWESEPSSEAAPAPSQGPLLFDMDVEAEESKTVYLSRRFGPEGRVRLRVRDVDGSATNVHVTVYESVCAFGWVTATWVACVVWLFAMMLKEGAFHAARRENATL